jgi:alkaline phosphatase D
LQEAHRQHPFITLWDDHEFADDAWEEGALNHDEREGDWFERRAAAMRAYFEWMPIREPDMANATRIHRHFAFGNLVDLLMLDTRIGGRSEQPADPLNELAIDLLDGEEHQLLGLDQEAWLFANLQASQKRGTTWRVLGQQVMFGHLRLATEDRVELLFDQRLAVTMNVDQWDGYEDARQRVLGFIEDEGVDNVVILAGDIHSSWAMEVSKDPYDPEVYDPKTSAGALAVEFVTPGVTSKALEDPELASIAEEAVMAVQPHLRYVDLLRRGYILLDVTPERVQSEWHYTPTITEVSSEDVFGQAQRVRSGSPSLEQVDEPSQPNPLGAEPAP